jgi:hypothetical protein
MNHRMRIGMDEATRLTREGRLLEATALIQRMLGWPEPLNAAPNNPATAPDVIDAVYRVIEEPETPERPTRDTSRDGGTAGPLAQSLLTSGAPHPTAQGKLSETTRTVCRPLRRIERAKPRRWSRVAAGRARAPALDRLPARSGGQVVAGSYTNTAGCRAYNLYVPGGYNGQAVALLVMLHGCTQDADDLAAGTRMSNPRMPTGPAAGTGLRPPINNGMRESLR